jgi:Flp pilus assembly pilin Flp
MSTVRVVSLFTCINLGVILIFNIINKLYKDERGQGLAEYGLIVCLVSVVVILVMMNIGEANNNTLNQVANEMVE